MLPVGFELAISVDERPKTYALDSTATGIGAWGPWRTLNSSMDRFQGVHGLGYGKKL